MITLPITLVTLWLNGIATFWAFYDFQSCEDVQAFMKTNSNVTSSHCMTKEQASDFWKQISKPKLSS
jgi:hypothetical protein